MTPILLFLLVAAHHPNDKELHAPDSPLGLAPLGRSEELCIRGRTDSHGIEARFELRVSGQGSFSWSLDGPLHERTVFDGERVWRSTCGGPAYELELRAREVALFDMLAWSGRWASADGPARIVAPRADEAGPSAFRLRGGRLEAQATIDEETGLLERLAVPGNRAGRRWSYSWASTAHGWLPSVARLETDTGLTHRFEVDAVELVEGTRALVAPACETPASFHPDLPAELKVRRAATGHLFVRPTIAGEDVGWFLLDSGVGATLLTAELADRLGLEPFGEARLTGFGPDVHTTRYRRVPSLRLGPLEIHDFLALERVGPSMAGRILGERVDGVLGWDVFLRSIVVLDPAAGTIALHDPATFVTKASWQPLTLHWNVPYVTARFEGGREGLFLLDTGAGNATVLFHADAVERLGLLEGRSVTPLAGGGAGGAVTLLEGSLEWFELAGVRHAPAPARFSTGDDGEADPYTLGFLGAGWLGDVELIFDYGGGRVAFR